MKLIIGNTTTTAVIGGLDNLLPINVFNELDTFLKVRPKGYQHVASFKRHQWDGYKHFITKKGVFATGFLPLVIPFLEELEVPLEIIDQRENIPPMAKAIDTKAGEHELFSHQEEAVKALFTNVIKHSKGELRFPRGIVDHATNSGKSSVIVSAIKNAGDNAIVLVDRKELFNQLYETLSTEFNVGVITSKKYDPQPVTLAMVKVLNNKLESMNVLNMLRNHFNILVVDECHLASSDTYVRVISKINAGMRLFVSGTPLAHDDIVDKLKVIGMSGKVLHKVSKKELMDKGVSLKVKVHIYLNESKQTGIDYNEEYAKCVMFSAPRIQTIVDILKANKGKKIVINFESKEHGYFMYEYIKAALIDCEIVHGTDPERDSKIADFKASKGKILLTSRIMQIGINIADIGVLIFAQGGKSETVLSQYSGRIERQDGVSEYAEIYDFYDVGEWVEEHSRKRISIYKNEQFEIIYHYEQKRGKPIKE
jgi:superfamily II DNA or RNA helicase